MDRTTDVVRAEPAGIADVSVEMENDLDGVLETLHQRIGSQKFNAWFKHGTRLTMQDGVVKVCVPNPFVANWIETHYAGQIASAVAQLTGASPEVLVTVDPLLSGTLRKTQLDNQAQIVDKAAQGRLRNSDSLPPQALRHRLEDFVVGPSNNLAYSAALAACGGLEAAFNPLFIHGSCGVGKTHLLQGVCNRAAARLRGDQSVRWRYVTGEQFTNEFITALRQKKIDAFRARYRQLDLLAIDDVHFLSAKKATQEEFLHTFNTIESAGRQVVMASDAHPRMVGDLNEQLVSRFLAGMVVKINAPDGVTRMEILRRRAKDMKLSVPKEALEYIAQHIRGSVRELEGALLKLSAVAALHKGTLTGAIVSEALADHLARTDSVLTLGDIEAAVAAYFGITPADIHSSRRTRTVSVARMVAMFLGRRHTRMSYPEIGNFMGKNHSSVVLAVQRMEHLLLAGAQLEWMTPAGNRTLQAKQVVDLLTEQFA